MKSWNCVLTKAEGTTEVTVGSVMKLGCSGESEILQNDTLQILKEVKKEDSSEWDSYYLKIIEVEALDDRHIEANVVSYRPGVYTDTDVFKLTDGKVEVQLTNLRYEVKTVLPQGEPPQLFPSVGTIGMPITWWMWLILAAIILVPAGVAFTLIKVQRKRKQTAQKIQSLQTGRPAFDELHRDLRLLEKKITKKEITTQEGLAQLDVCFKNFVTRAFLIAAYEMSGSQINNQLKKILKKKFESIEKPLFQLLREFKRLNKSQVSEEQFETLFKLVIEVTEKINKMGNPK